MSVWDTPTEKCPYCGAECEADWVDVEVGMQRCGPYHCYNCGASEIGPEMSKWRVIEGDFETGLTVKWKEGCPFTEKERETGWYDPSNGKRISPYANTVNGELVDHITAKAAYRLGLLDEKKLNDEGA